MADDEFMVVVTLPGTAERFVRSFAGPITVGRHEESDLVLAHPLVSRRHAELTPAADGVSVVVRDLGSRNGTMAGGSLLRDATATLAGMNVVQVGPYVLTITPPASASSETVTLREGDLATRVAIDPELRQVLVDGAVAIARVSELEYRLFEALIRAGPATMAYLPLGDAVWGAGQWDTYMLHNLARRVRRKFEDAGFPAEDLLLTVPHLGYRLA